MDVTVIDAGMGNLRSISNALAHVGGTVTLTCDGAAVAQASRLVLPGVGAFGRCMVELRERGILQPLLQRIDDGCPVFGICLGFQVLFERSLEHGEHQGLGRIPGRVELLDEPGLIVPHMGWNEAHQAQEHAIFDGIPTASHFYFDHSYRPVDVLQEHTLATTDYGAGLVCVVGRENLLGAQFHPEKSGPIGLRMLKNFLEWDPS